MTDKMDKEMLGELGESMYQELEVVYRKLRDLKVSVAQMHDEYVAQATAPDLTKVEAIHLMTEDVFADLQRYLLPECDPDSAYKTVRPKE